MELHVPDAWPCSVCTMLLCEDCCKLQCQTTKSILVLVARRGARIIKARATSPFGCFYLFEQPRINIVHSIFDQRAIPNESIEAQTQRRILHTNRSSAKLSLPDSATLELADRLMRSGGEERKERKKEKIAFWWLRESRREVEPSKHPRARS